MGFSKIDQNGFREQFANPISCVGVFPYLGSQIDFDGKLGLEKNKIYYVKRGEDELFAPEAMNSFNGKPVIIGHVMLGENQKAVDDRPADGCFYNVRPSVDTPGYLIADFTLWTEKIKKILQNGKIRELSLGYRCNYVPEEGDYMGKHYQFKQTRLRGNHIAVVEHGRCGSSVCVCDEAPEGITLDSFTIPEEALMDNLNKDATDSKIPSAERLASAVAACDEQTFQDVLDFYDLPPETRKELLAQVKGGKKSATAEDKKDAKAKDDLPPPPPPEKKDDEKKEEKKEDDKPAETTPAVEKPAEATPPAEKPEDKPAVTLAPTDKPAETTPPAEKPADTTPPAQPVDDPKADAQAKDKKDDKKADEKKEEKKEEKKSEEKKDDDKKSEEKKDDKCAQDKADDKEAHVCDKCGKDPCECAKAETKDCGTVTTPTNQVPVGGKLDGTEKKDDKSAEAKDGCPAPADQTMKDVTDMTSAAIAAAEKASEGDKTEKKDDEKKDDEKKDDEKKDDDKKSEEKKDDKPANACDGLTDDMRKSVIEEYNKARSLAEKVRPLCGTAVLDEGFMNELDVAKFAVKNIPSLSFAVDSSDDVILGVVKGHVAYSEKDSASAKKVYGMATDSAIVDNVKKEEPKQTKKESQQQAQDSLDDDYILKAYLGIMPS